MSSITRFVYDPEAGREVAITVYRRNGKLVVQRLPMHNFSSGMTPRRLEALAVFGEVASGAYGEMMTGSLPPAAERIRREMPERARAFVAPRRSKRAEKQSHYRGLLGEEALQRMELLIPVRRTKDRIEEFAVQLSPRSKRIDIADTDGRTR